MVSTYFVILALAFLSGLTTLVGVTIAISFKNSHKMIAAGLGFAAGIMLWVALFELAPVSFVVVGVGGTIVAALFGASLVMVLNQLIPHTHTHDEKRDLTGRLLKTAYLCAFGLVMHDFPEGFAMASSFLTSPNLGLLIALSIAIHNIPEEFAIVIPLVLAKKKRSSLFKLAFLFSLAEPLGAAIGILAAHLVPRVTPILLAFSAGTMIFIALHELIPTARMYERKSLVFIGMAFSLLVYLGLTVLIPG